MEHPSVFKFQYINFTDSKKGYIMDLIVWSHIYSINDHTVDSQHQKLIGILNDLHNLQSNNPDDSKINVILDELVNYTLYHFATEEKLFQEHQYPEYTHHKAVHDKLVKDVQSYLALFKTQDQTAKEKLMVFLSNWLKDHILGDDKAFGLFLSKQAEFADDDL